MVPSPTRSLSSKWLANRRWDHHAMLIVTRRKFMEASNKIYDVHPLLVEVVHLEQNHSPSKCDIKSIINQIQSKNYSSSHFTNLCHLVISGFILQRQRSIQPREGGFDPMVYIENKWTPHIIFLLVTHHVLSQQDKKCKPDKIKNIDKETRQKNLS